MTEKINGYGRTDLAVASSRAGMIKSASQGEAARNAGGDDTTRTTAVSLTDTAVRLKQIEAELAVLPDVDQDRVDSLRERIAAGDYTVDSQEIARRLVQIEQQMP